MSDERQWAPPSRSPTELGWSVRTPMCLAAVTCFVSDGGVHRVVLALSPPLRGTISSRRDLRLNPRWLPPTPHRRCRIPL
jgi:hypothetical protein